MIEQLEILKAIIGSDESVTFDQIRTGVEEFLMLPRVKYKSEDSEMLIRFMEAHYTIKQASSDKLIYEDENSSWLWAKRDQINFERGFWGRYLKFLKSKKGYPQQVINRIDNVTDEILNSLFDPSIETTVNKRGLVVGNVQSGKTANYSGLICKAADAGFDMIIVLTGIHSNLRTQTQYRIDESFLGFDTKLDRNIGRNERVIGVGRLDSSLVAHSLTTGHDRGDFNTQAAIRSGINFNTREPIIAVIKKNTTILKKLNQWLKSKIEDGTTIQNKSLLLIDDEADNASINISNTEELSSINRWITNLLGLFDKNVYVGYTATPFANIFIPMDDYNLFPRNFIHTIPPPSNYIGPEKIFGVDYDSANLESGVLPLINNINDHEFFIPNKHKKNDPLPSRIPDSLECAIIDFMLVCGIREIRNQKNSHNSMLIHVTRYTNWQEHLAEKVSEKTRELINAVRLGDNKVVQRFKIAFEDFCIRTQQIQNSDFATIDHNITVHEWSEVYTTLPNAISKIQIRSINGGSADVLDYLDEPNGLNVIAIGGDKLSRGLTLEGLSVSYYLRSSKMYDTLMQMGRWFGYRTGYVDLCRLYISDELNHWFCHITLATQELLSDFQYMTRVAGSTPRQFALKVRTHPTVLNITATNKMRGIERIKVSWSATLNEVYIFKLNNDSITKNIDALNSLINQIGEPKNRKGNKNYWDNVNYRHIINFLESYDCEESLKRQNPIKQSQYINNQVANNELIKWNILIADGSLTEYHLDNGISIKKSKRTLETNNNLGKKALPEKAILQRARIGSPQHESIDLNDIDYKNALQLTRQLDEIRNNDSIPRNYPSGQFVREYRNPKEGLIVFYLLDIEGLIGKDLQIPNLDTKSPLVGFMISYPKSKSNIPVEYAVHQELLEEFDYDDEN